MDNCLLMSNAYHMHINIKARIIQFWTKMLCGKKDKLSHILNRIMHSLNADGVFHAQWLNCIKTILQNCNLDGFWDGQFNFAKLDNLKASEGVIYWVMER